MSLSVQDKRKLVAAAHHLNPIVSIGKEGLTKNLYTEIDRGLYDHELIKVRFQEKLSKSEKAELSSLICEQLNATSLKIIGHVMILYRFSNKKKSK